MLHGHSTFDYQQMCKNNARAGDGRGMYIRDKVACLVASDGDCDLARRCIRQVLRRDEEAFHRRLEEERRYRRRYRDQ